MNYRKIFWGIVLILIGILIILKNTGVIYYSWYQILMLWPLLLILWGISIIPAKTWIRLSLSLVAIVLAFIMIAYVHKADYYSFRPFYWFRYHERERAEDNLGRYKGEGQVLNEPYDTIVTNAELKLDAAAGAFEIGGQTTDMIEFDNRNYLGEYSMMVRDTDGKQVIDLSLKHPVVYRHNRRAGKAFIRLNEHPVWDFNLNIGAADMQMDMSHYKTRDITLDGGASSIEMTVGDKYPDTHINLKAGASSVRFKIPESSGCQVNIDAVLSSRDLEGFSKIGQGKYQTGNFEASSNKIMISIDAAVSSLEIIRY